MTATRFKFILSDLDGVIRHFPNDRDKQIEEKHQLPIGSLWSTAFEKTLLSKAVCGIISDESWRQKVVNRLSKIYPPEKVRLAVKEWSDFPGNVDWEYLKTVEKKFPGIPLTVLTNGTTRLSQDLKTLGLHERFFKVFSSAEIGVCKPDTKIFKYVLEKLACLPAEVLFIDDSESHVRAAQEIGMTAHHYRSLIKFEFFGSLT